MKTMITKVVSMMMLVAVLSSCKKNDKEVVPENPGNYILAVTPVALTGKADYLITAGSLEEGKVSIIGNGVEQDGT
ncbi:MAG: hypothetical protein EOO89_29690, partial [Pedobacter sp.]